MTCLEHYFENLIFGKIKNDPNKEELTKEQIEAVETCAQYVIYTLFNGRENLDKFLSLDRLDFLDKLNEEE